jgi:hypothetical protein
VPNANARIGASGEMPGSAVPLLSSKTEGWANTAGTLKSSEEQPSVSELAEISGQYFGIEQM